MKLLRNPEVFHSLLIFIVISVPAVFVSWVWDKDFGAFTLLLCILFLVLNNIHNSNVNGYKSYFT